MVKSRSPGIGDVHAARRPVERQRLAEASGRRPRRAGERSGVAVPRRVRGRRAGAFLEPVRGDDARLTGGRSLRADAGLRRPARAPASAVQARRARTEPTRIASSSSCACPHSPHQDPNRPTSEPCTGVCRQYPQRTAAPGSPRAVGDRHHLSLRRVVRRARRAHADAHFAGTRRPVDVVGRVAWRHEAGDRHLRGGRPSASRAAPTCCRSSARCRPSA